MIAILVPVLARPQNAQPLIASIRVNSFFAIRVLFLCTPGDDEEIRTCQRTGADVHVVDWEAGPGDWAKKINEGYRLTKEPFILLGADDLFFHQGWDRAAIAIAKQTGVGVIGTNDLGNATVMRGAHSTHPLIRRSYVREYGTIDEPDKILHEGYAHQWVDTELIATAKFRGEWAFAQNSHVEHLHPFWHKGVMDATYEKALSTPYEDNALFRARSSLWSGRRARLRA